MIVFQCVKKLEGVESGVIRKIDGVGERRIGNEARVIEESSVEERFEKSVVCPVPRSGSVACPRPETRVAEMYACVRREWVDGGTFEKDVGIEFAWEFSDVYTTTVATWCGEDGGPVEERMDENDE